MVDPTQTEAVGPDGEKPMVPFTTTTDAESVQPFEVPVTSYTVVAIGLAVKDRPLVPLSPVPGDHVYFDAPEAVNVTGVPQ